MTAVYLCADNQIPKTDHKCLSFCFSSSSRVLLTLKSLINFALAQETQRKFFPGNFIVHLLRPSLNVETESIRAKVFK